MGCDFETESLLLLVTLFFHHFEIVEKVVEAGVGRRGAHMHRRLPDFILEKQFVGVIRLVRRIHEEGLLGIRLILGVPESVLLFEVEAEECLPIVVLNTLDLVQQSQIANLEQL